MSGWITTLPPGSWSLTDDVLTVTAGAGTDIFVNPLTGERKENAPRGLFEPPAGDWQFSARLRPDDAVGWSVDGDRLWLRISHVDGAFTFHASEDGRTWHLARQFALGPAGDATRVGIEVQSPAGEGCAVDFDHVVLLPGSSRG
ncbi:DUF1349 domain-containing protein [Streptomyces sp. NPDC003035]|uniref:DUF1349 domain-containing protein n=1 Tax=Streptomyces sp. NPDC003035 TaxID=3364676 RepID=UPI00367603CC